MTSGSDIEKSKRNGETIRHIFVYTDYISGRKKGRNTAQRWNRSFVELSSKGWGFRLFQVKVAARFVLGPWFVTPWTTRVSTYRLRYT